MSSIPNPAVEITSTATLQRPIHTLVGGGLLLFVIGWAAFGSGDITMFIDVNSMILVLGIMVGGLWMCYGPKAVVSTFRPACRRRLWSKQPTFSTLTCAAQRSMKPAPGSRSNSPKSGRNSTS